MSALLLAAAKGGDAEAFGRLIEPHRPQLALHCYRVLGSVSDAEDVLQETLLAAWRGLPDFHEHASLRSWLYRIATNHCLNWLRAARRRSQLEPADMAPERARLSEITWLEPYPDVLLENVRDPAPGPAARYEAREAISLAFITVLQLLPPRQRVALILRDVLGFRAAEVARLLDSTEASVTSALKRARATIARGLPQGETPPPAGSAAERKLLTKLVDAFEHGDTDTIVTLLTDDARLRMPPFEYQGREQISRFSEAVLFSDDRRYQLVPTRANGQPAFGLYLQDQSGAAHAFGMFVLTLSGERISAITRFDNAVMPGFGLPRSLPRLER